MRFWIRIHDWPLWKRWLLKAVVLALTVLIVCFPHPVLLARHLGHWSEPNAMIDAESKALDPLVPELMNSLPDGANRDTHPKEILRAVELLVYKKLPYAFDWDTWGMADYMPTVDEALAMGREDCDGRAVVGASLLKRIGFESQLRTDGAHVWVTTPQGDTMGPGKVSMIETTPTGVKVNTQWLWTMPRILAVNTGLFPLVRELIIAVVLWGLLLHPAMRRYRMVVIGTLIIGGLFLLRSGGNLQRGESMTLVWLGIAALVAALICCRIGGRRKETPEAATELGFNPSNN
ncbi:MAG TPA: hypothetical protein PKN33_17795 [Phycisphaerae bacterium]|nr:hypothetical protein [Phycisphaerae bacterium]